MRKAYICQLVTLCRCMWVLAQQLAFWSSAACSVGRNTNVLTDRNGTLFTSSRSFPWFRQSWGFAAKSGLTFTPTRDDLKMQWIALKQNLSVPSSYCFVLHWKSVERQRASEGRILLSLEATDRRDAELSKTAVEISFQPGTLIFWEAGCNDTP